VGADPRYVNLAPEGKGQGALKKKWGRRGMKIFLKVGKGGPPAHDERKIRKTALAGGKEKRQDLISDPWN